MFIMSNNYHDITGFFVFFSMFNFPFGAGLDRKHNIKWLIVKSFPVRRENQSKRKSLVKNSLGSSWWDSNRHLSHCCRVL